MQEKGFVTQLSDNWTVNCNGSCTVYPSQQKQPFPLPYQTEDKIEKLISVINEQQQRMVDMMAVFLASLEKDEFNFLIFII